MRRATVRLTVLGAGIALATIGAVRLGGWAVITVDDLPDYAEAGRPVTISYVVRQHGFTLLSDLASTVEARSGSAVLHASAKSMGSGHYSAQLVLPSAGDWNITIRSGFGRSDVTLLPLDVVAPKATPGRVLASAERGKRLFVAKGCLTCHVHQEVTGSGVVAVGPELTGKRFAPQYLAMFLTDPSIKPPAANGQRMPKLDLRAPEIASLTSFINAEKQVTAR
jgi:mono/diheme cytochrome c family protein